MITNMTTDLQMLFAVSILSLLQFMPYFMAHLKHWGITGIVSNRDNMPALPSWAVRAQEAQGNLNENLIHFSIIVLVLHVLGLSNEMSALGATVFFYARAAYWVLYIAGVTWLRTMAFMAGLIGEIIIIMQFF